MKVFRVHWLARGEREEAVEMAARAARRRAVYCMFRDVLIGLDRYVFSGDGEVDY